MEVFIGRQPILDRRRDVAGYELLFRSTRANFCDLTDAVAATSQVIVNAVLGVGLDRLLGGKPAFINFDRTLLLGDWTTLLPPGKVVIEILETVQPDQEVLEACHKLQQQGYALALDDCLDNERTATFAPFVDILKVDFQQTTPSDQERIVKRYQKLKIRMVAEKVETEEEFERAYRFGYGYFQGYFFARPTVIQASRVPTNQMSCLRLINQVQRDPLDFQLIEQLVRQDVAFSHSLLTYLNSAVFAWANRVESVRHALMLLGSDEIRRWAWMASVSSLGQHRPAVLMNQVLLRGRFCEAISVASKKIAVGDSDPFLLGMFSLLDAILQRPLAGILNDLNISLKLRNALLGTASETDGLSLLLRVVKAYETGDWQLVQGAAQTIGISVEALSTCYLDSLSWVETVLSEVDKNKQPSYPSGVACFHRLPEDSMLKV